MVAEQALARQRKKTFKLTAHSCVLKWINRSSQGRRQPGGNAHAFHIGVALRRSHSWHQGQTEADSCVVSPTGERRQQASSLFRKFVRETVLRIIQLYTLGN